MEVRIGTSEEVVSGRTKATTRTSINYFLKLNSGKLMHIVERIENSLYRLRSEI